MFTGAAEEMVKKVTEGFNATIFMYGQTGSGKTHTMTGTADDPGLIPRCNAMIFDEISRLGAAGAAGAADGAKRQFLVRASYLEIYNECVHDLCSKKAVLKLKLEAAAKGGGFYPEGITERIVLSSGDKIEFTVKRPGVAEPLVLTSGFDRPESKWFQRSGLRQVGLAPAGPATIGDVVKGSPADKAGLKGGDVIVSVDGKPLFSDIQLAQYLKASGNKTVTLEVERELGLVVSVEITPEVPVKPEGRDPMIGVIWNQTGDVDVRIVHPNPFVQVADSLKMMWVTIISVADPGSSIGVDHLSGPVGIGQMLYSLLQTDDGWRRIIGFMVLFNVNLAVLNMLPFPVLDGGHITLALMEKIFGKPVQMKTLEIIQTVCALGLISLMLYVTSKDIGDKFGRGGGKASEEIQFAK